MGQYEDQSGKYHGFQYSGSTFSSIDFPGATSTLVSGINDNGQIVGYYVDQAGNYHGFLDSGGSFSSINYPGAPGTFASGINDSGLIVGTYLSDEVNESDGFVATPVQ